MLDFFTMDPEWLGLKRLYRHIDIPARLAMLALRARLPLDGPAAVEGQACAAIDGLTLIGRGLPLHIALTPNPPSALGLQTLGRFTTSADARAAAAAHFNVDPDDAHLVLRLDLLAAPFFASWLAEQPRHRWKPVDAAPDEADEAEAVGLGGPGR